MRGLYLQEHTMRRSAGALLLSLVALGLSALPGCSSDVDERLLLAGLGNDCRINSDCAEHLACVFQRCHQECVSSRDCDEPARCIKGEHGGNVCQLPDERACVEGSGCPGQQVCGVDTQCRDACSTPRNCVAEQACSAGTCADASEVDDDGQLLQALEPPALTPCVFDSDCPNQLVCREGACLDECLSASDCGLGQTCREGSCVVPVAPSVE